MAEITVTIRSWTFAFRAWIEVCRALHFLGLSEERTMGLAVAGKRLVLIKIDNGRWRSVGG
jgi:hypothetical protein